MSQNATHGGLRAIARQGLVAFFVLSISLGIGIFGYHHFEGLDFLDSLLNASMILGGMGPVNSINTVGGKLFASFYAIFSGIVFLAIIGIMFGPLAHRVLHKFHIDDEDVDK